MNNTNQEIEVKYLIYKIPSPFTCVKIHNIVQGYISTENDSSTVRLRKMDDQYFITVKNGSGIVRNEYEVEITKEQFENLWLAVGDRKLYKDRYIIPYNDHLIELDVYKKELKGLITAEVEFDTVESLEEFVPPSWFDDDVTNDYNYTNQYLAIFGLPPKERSRLWTKNS